MTVYPKTVNEKYIENYKNVYKRRSSTNTGGDQGHIISPRDATASIDSIPENGEIVNGNISDLQDDGIISLAKERAHYDMDYGSEDGRVDEEKSELGEVIRFEEMKNEDGDSVSAPVIRVGKREVSAADIDFAVNSIYSNIDGMDVDVANEMIKAYKKYGARVNARDFSTDWKLAYQMGLANRSADSTDFTSYGFKISPEAAEGARAFGQAEYRGERTSREGRIKEAQKNKTGREGSISTEKVQNKKLITDGARTAAKVLSVAGYNVEFFEDVSETADRGSYDWDTNTIRLNVAVGTGRGGIDYVLGRTLSHELVHSIQRWNPEGYEELKGFIIEKMGDSFEGMVSRKMKRLGLSYDGAVDEVIADGCEMMLRDSKALTDFAKEHRTLFEKICDVVEEFIGKIRNAISSLYGDSTSLHDEARFMELYSDELQKVFDKVLSDALNASEATVDHTLQSNANKKAAEDGGRVQYSKTYTKDGTPVVWIDQNILSGKNGKDHQIITDYLKNHVGDVFTIIESGQRVYLGEDLPGEYMHSNYTTDILKAPSKLKAKKRASSNLGEIIEIASQRKWEEASHVHNKDAKYGIYKYKSLFAFPTKDNTGKTTGAKAYNATLVILNSSDGKKYLYDLVGIKENTKFSGELSLRVSRPAKQAQRSGASIDSISDFSEKSKGKVQKSAGSVDPYEEYKYPSYAMMPEFGDPLNVEYAYQGEGYTSESGLKLFPKYSVDTARDFIMSELGIDSGKTELARDLNEFYTFMATAKDLSWEDIEERAGAISDKHLSKRGEKVRRDPRAQEALDTIRGARVTLDEKQKADAKALSGSFGKYRQSLMGRVNIVNGGISLDTIWQEWAEEFPEYFSADTNSNDMPRVLLTHRRRAYLAARHT